MTDKARDLIERVLHGERAEDVVQEIILTEAMTADDLIKRVESEFKKHFPKSYFNGKVSKGWGSSYDIDFRFGLLAKKDWPASIEKNDPSWHILVIDNVPTEGTLPDKLEVRAVTPPFIMSCKTDEKRGFGHSTIKTGWRKAKGNPQAIVAHMSRYFAKLKKLVKDNIADIEHSELIKL